MNSILIAEEIITAVKSDSWHSRHEVYKKAKNDFNDVLRTLAKKAQELQQAAKKVEEGSSRALVKEAREIVREMKNYLDSRHMRV